MLFADDQIPDESIPDDKIEMTLKHAHPDWDTGFVRAQPAMRKAVRLLTDAGYNVTCANTLKGALKIAEETQFDLAIIDLGWYADDAVPPSARPSSGWQICDVIDKADQKRGTRRTPQIIYSNRFMDEAGLSIDAANRGKLPLFKGYTEATHQSLKAAVKFIDWTLSRPSDSREFALRNADDFQKILRKAVEEPLIQQRQWFRLTLVFVALSFVFLLAGVFSAMFLDLQVGVLTSVAGVVNAAVSGLLYGQLQRKAREAEGARKSVEKLYHQAVERLDGRMHE